MAWSKKKLLSREEAAHEALVMGLRLAEGIEPAALAERLGVERLVDDAAVDRLVGHGLLERDGDRACGRPPAGRLLLEFDPGRNRRLEGGRGRRHDGRPGRRDLPHFEQPLGDAVAAEAEVAVDPGEAVLVDQARAGNGRPIGQLRALLTASSTES